MNDETKALSQYIAYNEMETNTMVNVTIAIPRIDGYEEVTTFEYESLRFDDGADKIDEDFIALVADDARGEPVVEVLSFVFDDEVGGSVVSAGRDDVTREIERSLSNYAFDDMQSRLDGDEPFVGSFSGDE